MLVAIPEPLALDRPFFCVALACVLPVRVCVLRQRACERTGTRQLARGQGWTFPTCARCPQGSAMLAVPGAEGLMWRGAGRGWLGRFERSREGRAREAQEAARERLEREGALSIPPCLDAPPGEPDEDDVG